jgi:RHS repeat-associated protein
VKYTLVSLTGTNDPDTGDIYSGWDRFGRVKDCRWYDYGHTVDVARLQYGYDRVSDRLWRADLVAQSLGKDFDELYSYDGLHRLKDMQRGLLNGSNTAITVETFAQCWSLDPTSNWHGFREANTGTLWTTLQSRSTNAANEITDITNSIGSAWPMPEYDEAGNLTVMPQPVDPTKSYMATYDAWNRMVQLVDTSDSAIVEQNQYDPRSFRTLQKGYADGILEESRHWFYSSRWQSLEERLGDTPNSADPERQQVWGRRYIDDLVQRDRDTGDNLLNERLYGLQDANWSLVALTMISGVKERFSYSPYGDPRFFTADFDSRNASSSKFDILFCGYSWSDNTQLYLVRTRHLLPLLGSWIQRDSDLNQPFFQTYVYALSNPINFTDPSGLAVGLFVLEAAIVTCFLAVDGMDILNGVDEYKGSGDSWRHCLTSCRMAKLCGASISELAGLQKELAPNNWDDWMKNFPEHLADSIDDILANQACLPWESFGGAFAGWVGTLCRETCTQCCNREIGFKTTGM